MLSPRAQGAATAKGRFLFRGHLAGVIGNLLHRGQLLALHLVAAEYPLLKQLGELF